MALPTSQQTERSREKEQKLRRLDVEAIGDEQATCLPRRERVGVSVERDRAHDEASSGIPRVVLTQGEHTSGAKSRAYLRNGLVARVWRNVMKDAVAICDVSYALGDLVFRNELNTVPGVFGPGGIEQSPGHIGPY